MSTPGVFFGWWVAPSFAVMAFLSSGIRFAVGPFLKPMVADLGFDRASFSLVIAFGLLLLGASALSATIGERPRPVAEASRARRERAVGVPRNAEASEGASRPF